MRKAWGLRGTERVVLNLARLTGWKGQSVLIEAAALPPLAGHDDVVVILAGDEQGRGGYRRELEEAIAARGLGGRVRIVGHCDDVPAAFTIAEVAVIASTEPEAFGRAAVEAEAMGVPVVAAALGAVPETVLAPPEIDAALRTGWHVPPNEPQALSAAIGEALALTPAERQALARRARAHAAPILGRGDVRGDARRLRSACCAPATRTAPKPAKNRRELTCGRNFPILRRCAVAVEAGAAYIYFRQQRKEK